MPPAAKNKLHPVEQNYWFVLGREPLLSAAEIIAVAEPADFELLPPLLKFRADCDPLDLISRLGGTIKIGKELAANISEQKMIEAILDELRTIGGKINFGISLYGAAEPAERQVMNWGKQIKELLKKGGRSVRYVFSAKGGSAFGGKNEAILSSVTVSKNGLDKRGREFLISLKNKTFSVAKTLVVQPFEEWGKRDFGRPGRDDQSGMLPPKLALIVLNLAKVNKDAIVLDPFCGSGTILTEALVNGYKNIIGSDISEKAVADTKKNLNWINKNTDIQFNVFQSAISDLPKKIPCQSIDAIVTEPYLGKPLRGRETKLELERQITELKKLYLTSFQIFHELLKPGGKVVCVIPRFKVRNEWLAMNCLEEIKKIGFTPLALLPGRDYLLYHRPGQYVGREIWRFENTDLN